MFCFNVFSLKYLYDLLCVNSISHHPPGLWERSHMQKIWVLFEQIRQEVRPLTSVSRRCCEFKISAASFVFNSELWTKIWKQTVFVSSCFVRMNHHAGKLDGRFNVVCGNWLLKRSEVKWSSAWKAINWSKVWLLIRGKWLELKGYITNKRQQRSALCSINALWLSFGVSAAFKGSSWSPHWERWEWKHWCCFQVLKNLGTKILFLLDLIFRNQLTEYGRSLKWTPHSYPHIYIIMIFLTTPESSMCWCVKPSVLLRLFSLCWTVCPCVCRWY